MTTTTDLKEFGYREIAIAAETLSAYAEGCSYADHMTGRVELMMNTQSGNVFLTDEDCNVLMMNGDDLEPWLFTPYSGHEGFPDELLEEPPSEYEADDVEYLQDFIKTWSHLLGDIHEDWLSSSEEEAA